MAGQMTQDGVGMQAEIDRVLEKLNSLLKGDGSQLVFIESSGSSISVQFEEGKSSECESCVRLITG